MQLDQSGSFAWKLLASVVLPITKGQILQFVQLVRISGHCVLEICFNLQQVGEFIPSTL